MALVIGRETDGVSKEMLEAADKRVYLPIYGFSESLNLSVAAALIVQQLFFICPEASGSMEEEERASLRARWYGLLAS
jgi:tRNA C32,U32 (ribose-2'-O)-methylase TrmJ